MAEEAKDNKKNIIIWTCAALAAVIVIIVAIIFATRNTGINDSYFVSDGTKYVLTLESNDISMEDEQYDPIKAHLVYLYSGDNITDLKAYYEYADNSAAKAAYDYFKEHIDEEDDNYKDISVNGKYVVLAAADSQYKELTTNDVKEQIEFMEMIRNMGQGDDYEVEETEDTETTEDAEE